MGEQGEATKRVGRVILSGAHRVQLGEREASKEGEQPEKGGECEKGTGLR